MSGQTRPTVCAHCSIPLRPCRTTAEDYPGTHLHGSRGLCTTCYGRDLKVNGPAAVPQTPEVTILLGTAHEDPRIRRTHDALTFYIHERRRRGVPPTGKAAA